MLDPYLTHHWIESKQKWRILIYSFKSYKTNTNSVTQNHQVIWKIKQFNARTDSTQINNSMNIYQNHVKRIYNARSELMSYIWFQGDPKFNFSVVKKNKKMAVAICPFLSIEPTKISNYFCSFFIKLKISSKKSNLETSWRKKRQQDPKNFSCFIHMIYFLNLR